MDDSRKAEMRSWMTLQGIKLSVEEAGTELIERFEASQVGAVTLEDYTWGANLRASDRLRLIEKTRGALDAGPSAPGTSDDLPNDLSDAQLHLKWLRS